MGEKPRPIACFSPQTKIGEAKAYLIATLGFKIQTVGIEIDREVHTLAVYMSYRGMLMTTV